MKRLLCIKLEIRDMLLSSSMYFISRLNNKDLRINKPKIKSIDNNTEYRRTELFFGTIGDLISVVLISKDFEVIKEIQ